MFWTVKQWVFRPFSESLKKHTQKVSHTHVQWVCFLSQISIKITQKNRPKKWGIKILLILLRRHESYVFSKQSNESISTTKERRNRLWTPVLLNQLCLRKIATLMMRAKIVLCSMTRAGERLCVCRARDVENVFSSHPVIWLWFRVSSHAIV